MNQLLPKRIAILYSDAKREYFPTEKQYITEVEVEDRSKIISKYLSLMHIDVQLFPGDDNVSDNLKKYNPDFVLNLVDSVYGKEYLNASIPATLELLKIPYTGSGMMGQAINSNKYLTKNLLEQYGITTPKYQLIKDASDEVDPILDFPLITKLNEVHSSVEMDEFAICDDERSLNKRIDFLMSTYKMPVLLEEFIVGREVTVVVTEGMKMKVYAAEKIFKPELFPNYKIATFDANWSDDPKYNDAITYKKYDLPIRTKENIKTAFEVLKMEDYSKFDLRVDESGRHYIIDSNTNPALGPKEAFCAIGTILDMYDISFEDILSRLITNTLSALNNGDNNSQTHS